ncbi:hypothetical protein [Streptococcus ferus]|uniref:hypothetical protein n=1 Tax=Streptococcus ferus TaxID=1345 RepID=UPI00359FE892
MKQKRNLKNLIIVTVFALLLIVPFIALEMLNNVLTNGRSSRSWLENKFGTELSRVYPTQNVEDLFKEFPDGFKVEQSYWEKEDIIEVTVIGNSHNHTIGGTLVHSRDNKILDTIKIEYKENKFIFSDEDKAKTLWPYNGFLFQHLSIDKSFLSSQKLKDKQYSFQNGDFGLQYKLANVTISKYLKIHHQKNYNLVFGGSNSNTGYYYSVSVENSRDITDFDFSEIISDTKN